MDKIKTIKTNNVAEFGECLKAHAAINKDVHVILALETGQRICGYLCGGVVTLRYMTRGGERKCNYKNLPSARAVEVAEKWSHEALRLREPYLLAPDSVYYDEKDLGRFSVHARDTKHGLKYDVVRMAGFKRVSSLSLYSRCFRHLFRFQRVFTSDYRGACAIAEYLNAEQKKQTRLLCFSVVKRVCNELITIHWVYGASITSMNFEKKFNADIYSPEINDYFKEL